MAKAAIHYEDLIVNATLSVSSTAGDLVASNMQNYQPRRKWRGASASETIIADFGSKQYVPATWLIRHACSAQAIARIRISDHSDLSSPSYDADFYVWPSLIGYDADGYDGTRFIGYDGAPVTSLLPAELFNATFVLSDTNAALIVRADDGKYTGRYLGITLSDDSGAAVEVGVWRAGRYFMPTYDINDDREFGYVDPSGRSVSVGQDLWIGSKNKYRTETFAFGYLSEEEVNTEMMLLGAINGSSRPIIYMPFVENSFRSAVGTVYGVLDASPQIQQVRRRYDHYSYFSQMTIRGL